MSFARRAVAADSSNHFAHFALALAHVVRKDLPAFRTAAERALALNSIVLPMYKHSTQKNHRHILEKHLLPRFGDTAIADVTRQEVQAYVAYDGPYSRRLERGTPNGGQVGAPA